MIGPRLNKRIDEKVVSKTGACADCQTLGKRPPDFGETIPNWIVLNGQSSVHLCRQVRKGEQKPFGNNPRNYGMSNWRSVCAYASNQIEVRNTSVAIDSARASPKSQHPSDQYGCGRTRIFNESSGYVSNYYRALSPNCDASVYGTCSTVSKMCGHSALFKRPENPI